jgi:hypothetical protein
MLFVLLSFLWSRGLAKHLESQHMIGPFAVIPFMMWTFYIPFDFLTSQPEECVLFRMGFIKMCTGNCSKRKIRKHMIDKNVKSRHQSRDSDCSEILCFVRKTAP